MNRPQPQTCTGIILAGGRGQRLGGRDKGWLRLGGRPLISLVVDQFRPQVHSILISANRNIEQYAELGFPVLADAPGFAGPMAGILSGLQHMHGEWLISVPVDAPSLPPDYVWRMCEASTDAPLRVAHDGERLQPVYCMVHRELKSELERALMSGVRAPVRWQERVGALPVSFADNPAFFANINTPKQLDELAS